MPPRPDALAPAVTSAPPLTVDVVVPTRDTRALTLQCLTALACSTLVPAAVIVVDDGSRDDTAAAIEAAFPEVRLIRRAQAGGFTAAVNEGWCEASGDLVLLLNSDTEVDRDALRRLHDAFLADPRLGVAGASLMYGDGRPQWSAGGEPSPLWLFLLGSGAAALAGRVRPWRRLRPESQRRGDAAWVPATAMAVRREVAAAIGRFDPRLGAYAQDLDFCLRARSAGWRVAQIPDARVVHRLGATMGARENAVARRWIPEALVSDLARWMEQTYPPAHVRRLRRALEAGLRTRLLARRAAGLVRRGDRTAWAADSARYRAALDALRRQNTPE